LAFASSSLIFANNFLPVNWALLTINKFLRTFVALAFAKNHRLKLIVASILLLVVVIGFTALKNSEFIKVDTCLDGGGRFNYEQEQCEY